MKGFRNVLVHDYGGVDHAIVYNAATVRVDDFAAFKAEILDLLKKHERRS